MFSLAHPVVQLAVDNLLEGVQVIAFDWTYLYLNATAARQGQQRAEDLVGKTMMAVYPGVEQTELFTVLQRVMSRRCSERLFNEFTYPTGERRWFELLVEAVPDGICILSVDVTEQRTAERQLLQAQKVEVVGQLASGVAHDFNNVLTAILGYAELITEQIGPDKPIGRDLQEIVSAGERGAALAAQLLAFARGQTNKPVPVSLHSVVKRVLPMLRRLITANIEITTSFDTDAIVRADPMRLEQVIINLAVNARDAMLKGGTLSLGVAHASVDGESTDETGLLPGDYAVLSVSDTGTGMTPEVRSRIFEPFFTTKMPGHGTGLGLAVVQRIVHEASGKIRVYSEPGRGTTIKVYLPHTEQPSVALEQPTMLTSPVGDETVLLVEDEPGVRSFIRVTLERYGYRLIEAFSGEAALAVVAEETEPIDLLLTDVILPGIDGAQLAQRVARLSPSTVTLFMSGYSSPVGVDLPENATLLEKPFTAHTLLTRVRRTLGNLKTKN